MDNSRSATSQSANRRPFFKKGVLRASAATLAAGMLPGGLAAFDDGAPTTKGDIAILTFLSALEQVEADLWIQYAELGGATNQGLSPIDLELNGKAINTGLAPNYITALELLDSDMPQYIVDNTDDEISHHQFLNNYLAFKGCEANRSQPLCRSAAQPCYRRPAKRQTNQSETAYGRYDLVDALQKCNAKSGFWREILKRSPGSRQRAAPGDSSIGCRLGVELRRHILMSLAEEADEARRRL